MNIYLFSVLKTNSSLSLLTSNVYSGIIDMVSVLTGGVNNPGHHEESIVFQYDHNKLKAEIGPKTFSR